MWNNWSVETALEWKIADQIEELTSQGDAFAANHRFVEAMAAYEAAWNLLPEPRVQWEESTPILGALGDFAYFLADYPAVRDYVSYALLCPNGEGNGFLHFRLGAAHYRFGDLQRAADQLRKAYDAEGFDLFDGEDPALWDFLKSHVPAPATGWPDAPKARWWKIA